MKLPCLILVPLALACGPFYYQAPPPLPSYPERVATKQWTDLLSESQPKSDEIANDLLDLSLRFVRELPDLAMDEAHQRCDDLLDRNRRGEFSAGLANFLIEVRELSEIDPRPPGLEQYLEWRGSKLNNGIPQKPFLRPNDPPQARRHAAQKFAEAWIAYTGTFDDWVEDGPDAFKPYALVQRAEMYRRAGYALLSKDDFEAVVGQYPESPRAEVAQFMLGRLALDQSRRPVPKGQPDLRLSFAEESRKDFEKYLESYPEGRFANDALGWLGGLAYDSGQLGKAIDWQVKRLNSRDTREVKRAVLRECNELFARFFRNTGGGKPDFSLMATQPMITKLFVSHAIDPVAQVQGSFRASYRNTSSDRRFLKFFKDRAFATRTRVTSLLANLGKEIIDGKSEYDATSLLFLGWVASRDNEHSQAATLFEMGLAKGETDELLHGLAVAQSRLEQNAKAVVTFEKFFEKFPESTLTKESHFDYAIALQRSGRAGKALLIFLEERDKEQAERELIFRPDRDVDFETSQWIDSLVQFAPLGELKSALANPDLLDDHRIFLRRVVRSRALAEEEFEVARSIPFSPEPVVKKDDKKKEASNRYHPMVHLDFTEARWMSEVEPLLNWKKRIASPATPSSEKAELHLKIARHWQDHRGKITLPLTVLTDCSRHDTDQRNDLRAVNGKFLGLEKSNIDKILNSHDELAHALPHALKAAELSNEPGIAAPALEIANEALFRLAEFSPRRAVDASLKKNTNLSQKLVGRLRSDFPDRAETKRAISYQFLPPRLYGDWLPGDRRGWIADGIIGEIFLQSKSRSAFLADLGHLDSLLVKGKTINDLETLIRDLRKNFEKVRPKLKPSSLVSRVDHLDDLEALIQQPGLTVDEFREYVKHRLRRGADMEALNRSEALKPFVEFLKLRRSQERRLDRWEGYLRAYPDCPKSEAASLWVLRSKVRRAFPLPKTRVLFFPAAPRIEGYKRVVSKRDEKQTDILQKAITDHRIKFPRNRYHSDIGLLEAAVLAKKDPSAAVKNLAQILGDPNHPELYQDAALEFCALASGLLDVKTRIQLLAAFRQNPQAVGIIKKLAYAETSIARLRPILASF